MEKLSTLEPANSVNVTKNIVVTSQQSIERQSDKKENSAATADSHFSLMMARASTLLWSASNMIALIPMLWLIAQCGNFMILLSFRFYVKSNLRIQEVQNLQFLHILMLWILIFMYFCTFDRLKFTKLTKFRTQKLVNTEVLELQNWFHVKSEWQKNLESTLWCENLGLFLWNSANKT